VIPAKAMVRLFIVLIICVPQILLASVRPLSLLPHTLTHPVPIPASHTSLTWLQQHPEIKLATWLPAHPPFVINTDSVHFEGFTADYVALLQQAISVRFVVSQYPDRQAALDALRKGEVDLIAGDQSVASENPDLEASGSYLRDRGVLLHKNPIALNDWETLKGYTLVYTGDDQLRAVLHNRYPAAVLQPADDIYAGMASVVNSDKVVMWLNEVTATEINARLYENQLIQTPADTGEDLSLSFIGRRDNAPLIAAINDALGSVSMQIHAQIEDAWRIGDTPGIQRIKLDLSDTEKEWVSRHPVLPVLMVNSHIPLTFTDEEGQVSGFTISLLRRIAQQSGFQLTFQEFNNVADMRVHLKKHPDSLIAVADSSASHDPAIMFSRPYQITSWVLVTKKNFPAIQSLADMAGKKVAVFTGVYYLPELRAKYPKVKFIESDFTLGMAISMLARTVDGAIVPQSGASFVLKSYLADRFKIAAMLPIPPLKIALATGKDNAALISLINKMLVEIPPRTMDAQMSGWQMRYALDRFEIWGRYKDVIIYILTALGVISLLSVFFIWRNRLLNRTLAVQRKLTSQLESARQDLEKVSESKSLFLSQMSHEIRTPMNALIGLLELESRGKSSPEQRQKNITVAYDSAKSLLMLVGDTLDMAKIESGTFTARSVPLSLSEIMTSVSLLFRHGAEDKGLRLQTRVDVVNDRILSDPVILKQILTNLLSNAIKFTREGDVEAVIYQAASGAGGPEFVLEVTDSGPGMTPEQQAKLFQPFVQVGESSVMHLGTGLGLSICRRMATLLNGKLQVESEPGEGTTFIFRFPAETVAATHTAETSSGPSSVRSGKILIVDDHPPNRFLLSQQLAFAGHICITAEDGQQALERWQGEQPPFDIVITDCNMPGMSGFELVRLLREAEKIAGRAPHPIFGLTAMAEQEVVVRGKASGMTDCLFKPVLLDALLAHINKYLNGTGVPTETSPEIMLTLNKLSRLQPEAFQQLSDLMIDQNRQDMDALRTAVALEDFAQIRQRAHSLKGAALMADARLLADTVGRLEEAASVNNISVIQNYVARCETQVINLESELKRQQAERYK